MNLIRRFLLIISLLGTVYSQETAPETERTPTTKTPEKVYNLEDSLIFKYDPRIVFEKALEIQVLEEERLRELENKLEDLMDEDRMKEIQIELEKVGERFEDVWMDKSLEKKTLNSKASKEIIKKFSLPHDGKVEVENKYGDITVGVWNKDSVLVKAIISVSKRSEKSAKRALDNIEFDSRIWGNALKIKTKATRDNPKQRMMVSDRFVHPDRSIYNFRYNGSYSVDLDILMPEGREIEIENTYGDITVESSEGSVTIESSNGDIKISGAKNTQIENKHGDVEAERIDGNLEVDNSNGQISINGVSGNVLVNNKYGEIDILDVTGTVDIQNYNQDITLENVGESVSVYNKFGSVDISHVGNELEVDNYNGDVTIQNVKGLLRTLNKYGDINVRDAGQSVNIENYNGDVELENIQGTIMAKTKYGNVEIDEAGPQITCDVYNGNIVLKHISGGVGDLDLKSKYGKIKFTIPEDLQAKLSLETTYGSIYFKSQESAIKKDGNKSTLNSIHGNGKGQLKIEGYNTDIYLKE